MITERKRYFQESETYHMVESDARDNAWISKLPQSHRAVIVMEGVSMYFKPEEMKLLLKALQNHFKQVSILVDCYTNFAAKASKYKNPINDVGVTEVYGIDAPELLEDKTGLIFVKEHEITPAALIDELSGAEKLIFRKSFAGKFAKKMYRLYEYKSQGRQ